MTDDELCAAFDSATLPKEAFHHREHLRVAFIYFARHGDTFLAHHPELLRG